MNTPRVFALIGNPNVGKTTLFNALTGLRQKVGNYPGVTVEKKHGECFTQHGEKIILLDLPGTYSLVPRSPDEAIVQKVILGLMPDTPQPEAVICVVDASNLERNLYLVSQLIDLGKPLILALNMVDLAEAKGIRIDVEQLSQNLGIPVIPCRADTKKGLIELKSAIAKAQPSSQEKLWEANPPTEKAIEELKQSLETCSSQPERDAIHIVNGNPQACSSPQAQNIAHAFASHPQAQEFTSSIIQARYAWIQAVTFKCVRNINHESSMSWSDRIDSVLLHPLWGWLVFFAVMGSMFLSIFTLASYPMDWIEGGMGALSTLVQQSMAEGDLRDLIVEGALAGVGGVLIFLPQILILFFFIGLLEDTGYMARAALIMDRVMGAVGLNGKAFIPLLSSYACAIPGIMATRTIENPRDRLATILVAPWMSCSARLPVYSLMIATLIPHTEATPWQKAGIMLALYGIGTLAAFLTAWLLKRTLQKKERSLFLMELPNYRRPHIRQILFQMTERAWIFIKRAGTVILALSIVLWFLMNYPKSEAGGLEQSYAGQMGKAIEPIIKPLGFDWKIGIGIIASFAAREVFVSTMSIVYHVEDQEDDSNMALRDRFLQETWPDGSLVYTSLTCISLMLFYVFALQCVSTIAVVRRETNSWRWPLIQLAYMTIVAYLASLLVYQGGKLWGFS